MKDLIRILHLEGGLSNTAIIRDRLESEGVNCEITVAKHRVAFERALSLEPFELILCDLTLQDYDGITAICAAKEKQPDTPVIVISGELDEDDAVRCLHAGATDYLRKPRLERLGPSVRRVIEESAEHRHRKMVEEQLRENEERFRQLAENCDQVFWMTDLAKSRMLYVSPAYETIWGRTCASLYASPATWPQQAIHPEDRDRVLSAASNKQANGAYDEDYRIVRTDGTIRWIHDRAFPVRNQNGEIYRFAGVASDITERKNAEDLLAESVRFIRTVMDTLSSHIAVLDAAGRVIVTNLAWRKFGEQSGQWCARAAEGSNYLDMCDKAAAAGVECAASAAQAMRDVIDGSKIETSFEYLCPSPDADRWFLCHITRFHGGNPVRVVVEHVNITSTKKSQAEILQVRELSKQQLQESQMLVSNGTLVDGFANEINNTLAPILVAVELLRDESPNQGGELLELIEASVKRGADTIKQLLTFTRGVEGEKVSVQPRNLLNDVRRIARSTFPKSIELRTAIAKDVPAVLCDPSQMHQAFLNLCANARDAMPEGGILTLEAKAVQCDATIIGIGSAGKPGLHVMFKVADTGTGIQPEVMDRIFDPFFTTKGSSKSPGLGLSTVMDIIKGHGGFVHVRSDPGRGSCFEMYLPVATNADAGKAPPHVETELAAAGKSVLIVDDEPAIRLTLMLKMAKLGYKVLLASDGADALMQFSEHPEDIDLIFTDLNMPQMDGSTMIRALIRLAPHVKIIVMTGLIDAENEKSLRDLGATQILHKPFDLASLKKSLKKVFQAEGRTGTSRSTKLSGHWRSADAFKKLSSSMLSAEL